MHSFQLCRTVSNPRDLAEDILTIIGRSSLRVVSASSDEFGEDVVSGACSLSGGLFMV